MNPDAESARSKCLERRVLDCQEVPAQIKGAQSGVDLHRTIHT